MKTLTATLLFLIIGVSGAILTALPDLFPQSQLISVYPFLAALDAGLLDLNAFDEVDADGNAVSVLRRGDAGYDAVYSVLRSVFAPGIPSLQDIALNSRNPNGGAIFASKAIKWNNPQGEIIIFQPLLVLLEVQKPTPVCELRDLALLIRDVKVSYWAKTGSLITIIALIGEVAVLFSKNARSHQEAVGSKHNLSSLNYDEEHTRAKAISSTESGRDAVVYYLAVFLYVVLGVVLLLRFGKRSG